MKKETLIYLGLLFSLILISFIYFNLLVPPKLITRLPPSSTPKQLSIHDIHHLWQPINASQCQQTRFQPFNVGCPKECLSRRQDLKNTPQEPMYRMNLAWYLGDPWKYNPILPMEEQTYMYPPTSDQFLQTFVNFSQSYQSYVSHHSHLNELHVNLQRQMHISLLYFCCLTKQEARKTHELTQQWLKQQQFDLQIRFKQVECWHERFNSITHILWLDEQSQLQLLQLNHALTKYLQQYGIELVVSREEQMPFHVTILGVSLESKDIRPYLSDVYEITQKLSKEYINSWTKNQNILRIQFPPILSSELKIHNIESN